MKDISVCGIDCAVACIECNQHEALKDNPCKGCNAAQGKIFWTQFFNMDVCPIYKCVKEKQLAHCGKCPEIPCDIYFSTKDPSMPDDVFQKAIQDRVNILKSI